MMSNKIISLHQRAKQRSMTGSKLNIIVGLAHMFQLLYFPLFLLYGEKLHIYDNVFKRKKINIKPRMKFITAQHNYITPSPVT